jgi:chromate transporter
VPGPLFSFAAYLGAQIGGLRGAAVALVAIFLPGLLLVYGMLPFWHRLRALPVAQAAMRGASAAVVGILGAAFYSLVWVGTVRTPADFVAALAGFVALVAWRAPPVLVVVMLALVGWGIA